MTEPTPMMEAPCCAQADIKTNYLELFYATLFQPVQTFKVIAEEAPANNRLLVFSLISVILISSIAPLVHLATLGGQPAMLVLTLPLSAVSGIIVWGFMGLLIALLAYAFTGQARIRTFLTLSGLATLPWVLMGPVSLLKIGLGGIGVALCIIGALLIWMWTVLLFALAITETYRMTVERVLIVLAAPFAMFLVLVSWIAGFVENVRQMAPF
ncbi:MAG: hypothetical protein K0Q50_1635 [Vampirovibrio sp.]|nr:hypothetical protein [Vampirovibrio sp.]